MITNIILIASISAFILTLLFKWGAVEWLQIFGWPIIAKMASCDFCLSFWCNVIISAIFAVCTGDYMIILYPVITTKLTQILL